MSERERCVHIDPEHPEGRFRDECTSVHYPVRAREFVAHKVLIAALGEVGGLDPNRPGDTWEDFATELERALRLREYRVARVNE